MLLVFVAFKHVQQSCARSFNRANHRAAFLQDSQHFVQQFIIRRTFEFYGRLERSGTLPLWRRLGVRACVRQSLTPHPSLSGREEPFQNKKVSTECSRQRLLSIKKVE